MTGSHINNLCKSSQGLTLSTVSLALFRNMSKIKYKQLANIRFRIGCIKSALMIELNLSAFNVIELKYKVY